MTTATCLSLAEAIMQGDRGSDEAETGAVAAGAQQTEAELPAARRLPSAFASAPADHFPNGVEAPAGTAATAVVR